MATYAIVKTGGKQYKVAEGDVIKVEKLDGEPGAEVSLPVVLLVDGAKVTTDAERPGKVAVTGEVVAHTKGPKIRIHKFKNKTGYHKRQGHRQQLTVAQGHRHQVAVRRRRTATWHTRRALPAHATVATPTPSASASSGSAARSSRPARSSSASAAPSSTRA